MVRKSFKNYDDIVSKKVGYFRYEICLKSDASKLAFANSYKVDTAPAIHKLLSFDELSFIFKDHWVQENYSTNFSGKIHVSNELDYKEVLEIMNQLILDHMEKKFGLVNGIDYKISELGYINISNPPAAFYKNYWLIDFASTYKVLLNNFKNKYSLKPKLTNQ